MVEVIEALVEGGRATAGPPLGPALGPLGVNIGQVIRKINEKTADFEGMKVPVKVKVDPTTKTFEIEVGTPPVSALVFKELGVERGSSNPRTDKIGNLTIKQVKKIAVMKSGRLLGSDMKAMVKEILGTCVSLGVTVEGKEPREVIKAIDRGEISIE